MELKPVFSVSELNQYVGLLLQGDSYLQDLTVSGEISGFKRHSSGHLYFSLKDGTAAVRCVMFKNQALRLSFFPKDGMQVLLHGSAGFYERDGSFQLYVRALEKTGDGLLYQRFLAYKQELEEKGWFDSSLKKPIPKLPSCVGVVTSKTGAAIEDIRNVTGRRFPTMPLILYPASVQGDRAAEEIAAAIKKADREQRCQVLIVGRGGGSLEDLWCFNEPAVAEAIHSCSLPVISAVGHETDFSISDFVADLRAPTPSAAAELAVPELRELEERLQACKQRLRRSMLAGLQQKRDRLQLLRHKPAFYRLPDLLEQSRNRLEQGRDALMHGQEKQLLQLRFLMDKQKLRLQAVDPKTPLQRGYALITDKGGGWISSPEETKAGDKVQIHWQQGALDALILGKDTDNGRDEL